jgi:glycosyltransferase involved in cell wall biosynthesis
VQAEAEAAGILYISYDGMLEPLGQSQVLAYLEQLTAGHRIHLISFEKPEDMNPAARKAMKDRIRAAGIDWHPLRYHRRPSALATAWDIAVGSCIAAFLVLRHRLRLVHARSYVAALMALPLKQLLGRKFLFDMRGFWADERVDGGIWPRGSRLYRLAKSLERRFLLAADEVVTLTHASAAEIRRFDYLKVRQPPITVIPTCADLDRFSRRPTAPHPFTFGFVGATTWALFDSVLACFREIADIIPGARLLIVNRGEHDFIHARLAALDIAEGQFDLVAADHRDMPALISRMDAAAAIRRAAYSQIACSPTKLGEYLGCGIPCLVNPGVGDVVDIVEADRTGIVLRAADDGSIREAAAGLVALAREDGIAERCVAAAHRRFALTDGVNAYRGIYGRLLGHG